ncbi:MAG: hypothetical protein QFB87_05560 [Patescibacteria group bacterium]|nr:hypothetical protein [Patescibacteria group bacterium]
MRRRPKNWPVWILTGLLLVLLMGTVLWSVSDNQGKVAASKGNTVQHLPAYKDFDGNNIAFKYKSNYGIHQMDAKDEDLELYMFTADPNFDKRLAVSVSRSDGSYQSNSGYLLRQSQPFVYTKSEITVANVPAVKWIKNNGQEETVYIPRNDKIAVLAFVTTGDTETLDSEVTDLLSTFHWKN